MIMSIYKFINKIKDKLAIINRKYIIENLTNRFFMN